MEPPDLSWLDEKMVILYLSIFWSLLGIFSHSIIFSLSYFRFKEENKSFVLFTKFHSVMSIIGLIGGSLSCASREWLDEIICFHCDIRITFFRSVAVSHYAGLVWSFFSILSPFLITSMMIYRCLGFHGKTMTMRDSWFLIGYLVGISIAPPALYEIGYHVYDDHKDTFNLTLNGTELLTFYGVSIYFNNWPAMFYLNYTVTVTLVLCFVANVVATLLSYRAVASVPTLSQKLRNMYTAYFNLLLLCSFLMTICQVLILFNDLHLFSNPSIQFIFNNYSFPLTAFPNVLLGLGSIWFIPYMRDAILNALRIKNIAVGDIVVDRNTVSDHSDRRNPHQLLNAITDRPRIFVTTVPCRGVCYVTRHTGQEIRCGPPLSEQMEMRF